MSDAPETLLRIVAIGIGSTALLDLWNVVQQRAFRVTAPDFRLVGRWIGHFSHGRFVHNTIAKSSPIRGELGIGWAAHYVIGVIFAAALVLTFGLAWARHPSFLPALAVGLVSMAAPFLLMQPAFGFGFFASKTPNPKASRLRSLTNHTVFGIMLYFAAVISAAAISR